MEQELSHDKIRDQIVVFHDATPDSGDRRYTINSRRCMGPHTQEQRHVVLAMMTRPYKPRDSAQSALLLSYLSYFLNAPLYTP